MKIKMKDIEIELPDGTEVSIDGDKIHVKGFPAPSPQPFYYWHPAQQPIWTTPTGNPMVTWTGQPHSTVGSSTGWIPDGTYTFHS